jgi:hypothetical protein
MRHANLLFGCLFFFKLAMLQDIFIYIEGCGQFHLGNQTYAMSCKWDGKGLNFPTSLKQNEIMLMGPLLQTNKIGK